MRFKRLYDDAVLPFAATEGSAALDISAYTFQEVVEIAPNEWEMIKTGLAAEIPEGHFGLLCPRSGLGKQGITLANTFGIIDSDYRGEISIMVKNNNDYPFLVNHGMRVAQLLIVPYFSPSINVVEELEETVRGTGGFGSTGVQ